MEKPLPARLGKALAVLLLVVLAVAGGRAGFEYAKLRLALARARAEFAGRQFMRAEFWTGRALSADGNNLEAMRLMAEVNEAQDKPAALGWRMKVAQREPGNTGDVMAWAKSALRFGQVDMAVGALESLPAEFRNQSAEYNELMAGCALADHQAGLAEADFAKAAELDPGNPLHRVNLASFRLANSSSAEVRAAAARGLESALADPSVSLFAVRALLGDALRRGDQAGAERYADKMRSLPERSLSDELNCLEAAMAGPGFHAELEGIERGAGSSGPWAAQTGDWLNGHRMAAETLRWFGQLPEAVRSNVPVQITTAEAYLAMSDWHGLESFLAKSHWGSGEFLRRAMLIRCKRELSQPWEEEWKRLVTDAEASPPDDLLLAQLAIGWKWRDETLGLLWGAAGNPRSGPRALQYLWDLYSQTHETLELLRVAKAQLDLDPGNPAVKNNYAFLSLLLFGASEHCERLAQEASAANANVPEWAATYAFALHLEGKEGEAKKVMEGLPAEALRRPGVALYYAIILAANGEYPQARESLAKLNPSGMLPEERKLAADLAQQLNVASR